MLERPTPPLPVLARLLLGAAALLLAWAALLIVTGGIDVRPAGLRLSSRDPFRPAGLAFALLLVYACYVQAHAAACAAPVLAFLDRQAPRLAVGLALITLGTGLTYATFAAGGSDSYGYVSQSQLWLTGHLVQPQPFTAQIPWPLADRTFAPLGYRDAPGGGAIVPIYAPGLPMLMALMTLASGDCGPYLVVPLLGALTVWLTYHLGRLLASRTLGLAAAVLMASSPTFLFMLMPPMSDVPMTTFVLAAVVLLFAPLRGRAGWAGVALGGALLVRPNLVPLVPCFGLFVLLRAADWRTGVRDGARFTIGLLPGLAAVGAVHTIFYGAPWRSGYGPMDTLYGWQHLIPNLQRYPIWLLDTQTPLVLAAILPLAFPRRTDAPLRSALLFFAALIAIVWLCYLFYLPFEAWWFLRFLLPAFPPMLVLAAAGWQMLTTRLPYGLRAIVLGGLLVGVVGLQVDRAREGQAFAQWRGESIYVSTAHFVDQQLPRNAVVVSLLHSGSLRHYAGRLTMRYDTLAPEWYARIFDVLTAQGYRPYVVLSWVEEEEFRKRFGLSDNDDAPGAIIAELRWPVPARVRIYDPLAPRETPPQRPARIEPVKTRPCK